jgi:hypothetical protein
VATIEQTLALRDALRANLVDMADIAALAQVKHETVRMWKWRGVLPAPALVKSGVPLWIKDNIVAFLIDTGRLTPPPPKEEDDAP